MPIASIALIVLLLIHALTLQTTEADHYCGFGSCLVCFNVYEITRDENCRDLASRWHVSLKDFTSVNRRLAMAVGNFRFETFEDRTVSVDDNRTNHSDWHKRLHLVDAYSYYLIPVGKIQL